MIKSDKPAIVWFRNNLRIHDNPALAEANRNHAQIICIWIAEPRFFEHTLNGHPRIGAFRAKFLYESLQDLQSHLRQLGNELWILKGEPGKILPQIAEAHGIKKVYSQAEHTDEERRVEAEVAESLDLKLYESHTMMHPEDVVGGVNRLKKSFTSFRKRQERDWKIRPVCETPEMVSPPPQPAPIMQSLEWNMQMWAELDQPADSRAACSFRGGEQAALERVEHYLWNTQHLSNYKETRNGLIGADYSSKFSPWLAVGALSARWLYFEIKRYEEQYGANESTYWMVFELMWRDFFRFSAIRDGNSFFGYLKNRSWPKLREFQAWIHGETGQPFVDANMRELKNTGFMSNRGRQNVASYLIHDLRLPWVLGAAYFETQLIDYDSCSNYGNWTYLAGIGADPRNERRFNVAGQAERYDPDGAYVQLWD